MTALDIDITFGPPSGDRTQLSKARLATLDALYRHPLAHNLEWTDVVALFGTLGTVQERPHNDMAFELGGERHVVRKPHGKDLTTDEVIDLRHLLTRAGWNPSHAAKPHAPEVSEAAVPEPDLLVIVESHEARIYHLDVTAAPVAHSVIRPTDPSREREHGAAEEQGFDERIAAAIGSARRVVVIGHGHGHSNAAQALAAFLKLHHPALFQKIICNPVEDLSALTPAQLLAIGQRALTA